MNKKTLKELIEKLGELHKEAVKHTLLLTKPEAERLIHNVLNAKTWTHFSN